MPIIGEGNEEPNDNFVKQLVASAQAAADIMVERNITNIKSQPKSFFRI